MITWAIFSHCVPLPAPGPPRTNTTFGSILAILFTVSEVIFLATMGVCSNLLVKTGAIPLRAPGINIYILVSHVLYIYISVHLVTVDIIL